MELVKMGAIELQELSSIERWSLLQDADYRQHTGDFRENVVRLVNAADQGNFDKAALVWFDATRA